MTVAVVVHVQDRYHLLDLDLDLPHYQVRRRTRRRIILMKNIVDIEKVENIIYTRDLRRLHRHQVLLRPLHRHQLANVCDKLFVSIRIFFFPNRWSPHPSLNENERIYHNGGNDMQ